MKAMTQKKKTTLEGPWCGQKSIPQSCTIDSKEGTAGEGTADKDCFADQCEILNLQWCESGKVQWTMHHGSAGRTSAKDGSKSTIVGGLEAGVQKKEVGRVRRARARVWSSGRLCMFCVRGNAHFIQDLEIMRAQKKRS